MAVIHSHLVEQLTRLENRYPQLGNRLLKDAQVLQEKGTPLPEDLVQEILNYGQEFRQLQQQVASEGSVLTSSVSFLELKNLVKDSLEKDSSSSLHQKALQILDRVLGITHREQADFSPLQLLHRKARDLQQVLRQMTPNSSHPDVEALIAKTHPVSAVLTLMEEQDNLDDEQWLTLEETVAASFGKTLTVAISRGKLQVSPELTSHISPSLSPPPLTPAPQNSSQQLSEVIIIPSGANPHQTSSKLDPDILILESPPTNEPLHEVIIVPSTEIPPRSESSQVLVNLGNNPSTVSPNNIGLQVMVHLQGLGDRTFPAQEYAGTRGQSRRLEGFSLKINPPLPGLSLRYMAHLSGTGDSSWVNEGELVGARGQAKRIEGFAVELTGPQSSQYDVFYNAHIQNVGDSPVLSNGQYCGTKGRNLRVEGMRVWIKPKS